MIAIIDYGMGNLGSVENALTSLSLECRIVSNPLDLPNFDFLLLPGVGAFGDGMKNLKERGFLEVLSQEVLIKQKPFLGICLGMQLLATTGMEFGEHAGLGWIPGIVKKFEIDLRIPHIGWNDIKITKPSPLLDGIEGTNDFYFVHSYHFVPEDKEVITSVCQYGIEFTATVQKDNIFGAQFHPEKSQKHGLKMLHNFSQIKWTHA